MNKDIELKIGDRVFIKHPDGFVSYHTPQWSYSWTGTVIKLNPKTVTVEFEVDEPGRKYIRRYIDYQDIKPLDN